MEIQYDEKEILEAIVGCITKSSDVSIDVSKPLNMGVLSMSHDLETNSVRLASDKNARQDIYTLNTGEVFRFIDNLIVQESDTQRIPQPTRIPSVFEYEFTYLKNGDKKKLIINIPIRYPREAWLPILHDFLVEKSCLSKYKLSKALFWSLTFMGTAPKVMQMLPMNPFFAIIREFTFNSSTYMPSTHSDERAVNWYNIYREWTIYFTLRMTKSSLDGMKYRIEG